MKKLTKRDARKVLAVIDNPKGLTSGLGEPVIGEMCIEAAVCFALGQPHGDEPECVHPVVRAFKITLNDSLWSSNIARAKGMAKIGIAQLGSTEIDVQKWINYVSEQTIRRILPKMLRDLAVRYPKNAEAWQRAADKCEVEGTQESAEYAAKYAAEYAAESAAESAESAEYAAKYAAEYAAESAKYAAEYAAESAEYAAKYAAESAKYAKYAAESADSYLILAAEIATEACILCGTQGSKWLDIVKVGGEG